MPTFSQTTFSSFWKRILQFGHAGNNGTPTSVSTIQDGAGVDTAIALSDDQFFIRPKNDDNQNVLTVLTNSGNSIFTVDTLYSKVKGGASQTALNTQYAHFGVSYTDITGSASFAADTHYAIPFNYANFGSAAASIAMGSSTSSSFNDTNPATSLTISSTAMDIVTAYWYVMDDITIDRVIWWQGADAATGSSTAAYLMGYSVDAGTTATGGDLSGGVKLASSSTVTNAGYEQAYYNQMTIHSADVDAGKVILFTFCFDDTEATDYTINATVKFHLK